MPSQVVTPSATAAAFIARVSVSDNATDGPASGAIKAKPPGPPPTHVRALEDRLSCEITFPRINGYRYELPTERLTAKFNAQSHLALTTRDLPAGTWGRWAFEEIQDPWSAKGILQQHISERHPQ